MRLGCVLVSLALLASLILAACGLTPVVSGMGSSEQANEALGRMIQDFLDEKHPGVKDAVEWIGDYVLAVNGAGRVMIPKGMAEKLGQFAAWVASKFGMNADGTVKPGVNVVYSNETITSNDGIVYTLATYSPSSLEDTITGNGVLTKYSEFSFGTNILSLAPTAQNFEDAHAVLSFGNSAFYFFLCSKFLPPRFRWTNSPAGSSLSSVETTHAMLYHYLEADQDRLGICYIEKDTGYLCCHTRTFIALSDFSSDSLALDVAETITIPESLTDTQSVALDVGATESMSVEQILQGILDAILAGDLTATAEVVDTTEQPVDPEEPVVPLPPEGLDKLGAALTSRFPFSIPWDVYKGVQLLAAPAQAPYFEVDFFAPIAHRVGGWKGSTKIVLDFAEYEIIGQVSRWASTIGFCLMLASGTKRLIWTA